MMSSISNPSLTPVWLLVGGLFVAVVVGFVYLLSTALRRRITRSAAKGDDALADHPRSENPSAFMAASLQAVIQKLREQEKELAKLNRSERERAQQTERLSEAVTRNMPAGMLLVSAAGLVTSANPAAENALGVHALAFRRYTELLGPDSRLAQLIGICLEEGRTFRREQVEYATPDHELRQLGVSISPILHGQNRVTGAICLFSDLTELTALQKQMQMKENLAALGELSAGLAHEFKNALATISGYAQMIHMETHDGELGDYSQKIMDQTRALTHVVTEFLKFARPLDLSYEPVALGPVVERVLAEVGESLPQAQLTAEGDFGEVPGDEPLIRQALLNLVRNAAEAALSQAFEAHVVVRGSFEHNGGQAGQRVLISDNGPGISEDDLPKIFVPFYTTKANGTGLGLAVVQKILVQHGGTIEARNCPEGGAEFILWLPFARLSLGEIDSAAARVLD
ncbi:MAG: ATP-binding protein [Candidatus Acidiferrales bacterium]|jgi:PAS domain S-box-containing protein